MTDYQIDASSRRCAATGRELKPGDPFYAVLVEQEGKFVRQDFSKESWQGPPEGAFSFWFGRVPPQEAKARPKIDDELLLDCFRRLAGRTEPERVNFRYVAALLLMRRKRFKFEEVRHEDGQEWLVVRCGRTREQHKVVNPRLTEEQMASVQEEVFKVLGWE